ncbi:helix-turn-helix transcriptional regulator [Lacticaseibacillus rhamnosus]|uniref:helix-turn-helix transcriptional regulator n=1 Tax=Lacticaseibacillus TaxID=2759736 RepID=UPI003DA7F561
MQPATQHHLLPLLADAFNVPLLHYRTADAALIESFNAPVGDYTDFLKIQPSLLTPDTPPVSCRFDQAFICYGYVRGASDLIIVGPGKLCALNDRDYREFENRVRKFMPKLAPHAATFIRQTPMLGLETILKTLSTLAAIYNDTVITPQEILPQEHLDQTLEAIRRQLTAYKQAQLIAPKRPQPDMQDRIALYVRHGLLDELKTYINTTDYQLQRLGPTMLRHYQNATIILNSLCMRAAISGGANADTCYALGGFYIEQIEGVADSQALTTVSNAMLLDYCQRVRASQTLHVKDPTIVACLTYIENHLNQKLTVTILAQAVNLSPTYLSSRFKQQTHRNLPDYINNRRIDASKELLAYSQMPIADIADYFAFANQSYYQTLFKKLVGQTPLQYRKRTSQ